jgi:hypothetical protein
MATLTISLVVGAQTYTYTRTRTNANAQRIGPAYRKLLSLPPGATDQEVWNALGAGVADGIEANVLSQERVDQEAALITPLPMT